MANVSIARRYARALIDVAAQAGKLDPFGEQVTSFARALSSSPELQEVMVSPSWGRPERRSVTEGVMKSLGTFDPEVENFLKLLVDRNRMIFLPDIARLYRDLADARQGRIRGRVTSAVALPRETAERLGKLLAQVTGQQVVLETQVDPSLIGGVSAQVGSVMYDGSLRTQLEEMRRNLRG